MAEKKRRRNGDNGGRVAIFIALISAFATIAVALIGVVPGLLQAVNRTPSPTVQESPTLITSTSLPFVGSPLPPTPSPTASPTATAILSPTTIFNFVTSTPAQAVRTYPCEGTIRGNNGVSLDQVRVLPQRDAPSRPGVEEGSSVTVLTKQFSDQLDWMQIRYIDGTKTGWIPAEYVSTSTNCPP